MGRRIFLSALGLLVLLSAVLVGLYLWLDTRSGHAFIARQIAAYEFENGLNFRIGRIDGSIYDRARLVDIRVQDEKGTFATVPQAQLNWQPFDYLYGKVSVALFAAREMKVQRLPELKLVPDRDEPFLPDLDIRIDRLQIDRIIFDKAITGREQEMSLSGKARIADRRALIEATGKTREGDSLLAKLDAVPDDDKLDMSLLLTGPKGGLVAGLAGVDDAVEAKLDGKGSWARWDGRLTSQLGAAPLADIALSARDGLFTAKGNVTLNPKLAAGSNFALLGPSAAIDLSARLEKRVTAIEAKIDAAAFSANAAGTVDFAEGTFDNLSTQVRLLQPQRFNPALSGRNIRGDFLLNGAFAAPAVEYRVDADRLGWQNLILTGLTARGTTSPEKDRSVISLAASARDLTGLGAASAGLFSNVRLDGNLAYANGRLLGEGLKLRSKRLTGTGRLAADFGKGSIATSLKGDIDGYKIVSLGLFDVNGDVEINAGSGSGYKLTGTVRARSTRLESAGVQNFLGGQMWVKADVGLDGSQLLRIRSAQLIAPQFRVNRGSGTYALNNGALRFNGDGFSNDYGPVSFAVEGSLDRPVAKIAASRPGFGVGLRSVLATVRRNATGFDIGMSGETDYGPISGDLDVLSGDGPLTIDIKRGNLAGVSLAGRIRQVPAGPFEGTLTGNGQGFDGTVLLSAEGKHQRARIDAVAANASFKGSRTLTIGNGRVSADVVMFDQPQISADVQLGDSYLDDIFIAAARAKIDYRGGRGSARVLAEGRNEFPFRIAANTAFEPELWRMALTGKANGVAFASNGPVRIVPKTNGYELLPSNFAVGNGSILLEGDYDDSLRFKAKLANVNLALLNPFVPGLDAGGKVSGNVEWRQASLAAFPEALARIQIEQFRRNAAGSEGAQAVALGLVAKLAPDASVANVIIKRRDSTIGRLKLNLDPAPAGTATWLDRLYKATLAGGVRYNGPADLLFSLSGLPNQNLVGNVGIAADFSGELEAPKLVGVVQANRLTYENASYGTRLTDMRVRGVFTNDQLQVTELSATAGDGKITGKGFVNLSLEKGFPAQLSLDLDKARLARSELISTSATGKLEVTNSTGQGALVSGTLRLPETRFRLLRQTTSTVTTLSGIRRKSDAGSTRISGEADPVSSLPSNWKLDVKLIAPEELYVSGMGIESEWRAELHVTGTSDAPQTTGDLQLVRGTLDFAGRSFGLESGRISFNGGSLYNPSVRVIAASQVDGTTVRVELKGTGRNPEISFSSTPALPQDEIMARILFGNSVAELSALQAVQLAASLNSLRAVPGGLNPLGVLRSATGLDRLRIIGADEANDRGTAIALGQYLTDDVYIEIITDARGYTASQIEISLTRALSVLSQVSSQGSSNAAIRYRKDY